MLWAPALVVRAGFRSRRERIAWSITDQFMVTAEDEQCVPLRRLPKPVRDVVVDVATSGAPADPSQAAALRSVFSHSLIDA
jgi:hypothetical protein